ncbi:hypothetical protein SAMN05421812_119117 [Asanoa hainanensis]|uniref:Uncharacterized protein n=1 Tax=Asanoa hainanensis TaxID=560556 RepID=A0A239PDE2_9ACTN|nr:hypothetical protein [Asanoa hainanensis]SNT65050.1 hypothetical protein SAMN05421812_119117 [Asanoa hainanensis]
MTLAHLAALLLNPRAGYVGRHRAPEAERIVAAAAVPQLAAAKAP